MDVGDLRSGGDGDTRTISSSVVNVVLDWSSRLLVKVSVHKGFKKPSIYDEISAWRLSKRTLEDVGKDDWKMMVRLKEALDSEGYLRLELTNKSKKRLSQLTVCTHGSSHPLQINNGELIEAASEIPVPLGDLQPGRTVVVHILRITVTVHSIDSSRSGCHHSAWPASPASLFPACRTT